MRKSISGRRLLLLALVACSFPFAWLAVKESSSAKPPKENETDAVAADVPSKFVQRQTPIDGGKALKTVMAANGVDEITLQRQIAAGAEAKHREGMALLEGKPDRNKLRAAFEAIRAAADAGYPKAAFELGKMLEKGLGTKRDLAGAFEAYLQAAYADIPEAQLKAAKLLEQGVGTAVDYTFAAYWYEQAAKNGQTQAWQAIGRMYSNGQGFTQDYVKALDYFRKGVAVGDIDAQASIGMATIHGWGVAADAAGGIQLLVQAATQGSSRSAFALSQVYSTGLGTGQNFNQALTWLTQAAVLGDIQSQRVLGRELAAGKWGIQNLSEAAEWLVKASQSGDSQAAADLAVVAFKLDPTSKGFGEAVQHAAESAASGNPQGAFLMAELNVMRSGGPQIDAYVHELIDEAASNGDWRSKYVSNLVYSGASFNDAVKLAAKATQSDYMAAQLQDRPTKKGVTAPQPLSTPAPVLPSGLVVKGFSGVVNVEFTVRSTGTPGQIRVIDAPNPAVDSAIRAAINDWRFTPATNNGKAVATRIRIPVKFIPKQE